MRSGPGPASLLALVGLFWVLPFAQRTEACSTVAPGHFDGAQEMIECLIAGDPAIRAVASDLQCESFRPLRTPPPGQRPVAEELVTSLLAFVRTSDDLWLVDRIAAALASCEEEIWTPLFLDLLDHPSPQIRWRAIRHFANVRSADARPILEQLWEVETRSRVRADLLRSLARSGSTAVVPDCARLVDSGDPALSAASVDCLRQAGTPFALESVLPVARGSRFCLRRRALAALAAWPDSDEALEVLLEASRASEMPDVAVVALASFPQSEATTRLIEVAASAGLDPNMRWSAISAIAGRGHPDVVPTLRNILQEPDTKETEMLKYTAFQSLVALGVESPRPRSRPDSFTVKIFLECIVSDGASWTIRPRPGEESVRCWAAPGIPGDDEDRQRIPAGLPVEALDHFESRAGHWIRLDHQDCWVPVERLEPRSGPTGAGEETDEE